MMYFYYDINPPIDEKNTRYIIQPIMGGGHYSWLLTDENPNLVEYFAWVAEGNVAEEWQPEELLIEDGN